MKDESKNESKGETILIKAELMAWAAGEARRRGQSLSAFMVGLLEAERRAEGGEN